MAYELLELTTRVEEILGNGAGQVTEEEEEEEEEDC